MKMVTYITISFLIAVVASADMSSADYYSLSMEDRKVYLLGVTDGLEIARVLTEQHRVRDIFMIADLTVENLLQSLSVVSLEPIITSRIVKAIRRIYGYSQTKDTHSGG